MNFFFLHPRQLKKSLVFKLLCCSGFPLLPFHLCSPIVATVVGTSSGKEGHLSLHFCLFGLNVATTDGGGHLKKIKNCCTRDSVFQQSAQPVALVKEETLPLCPAATRSRIVARCRREASLQWQPPLPTQPQWNKEDGKKKRMWRASRCCCHVVRLYALTPVCVVCAAFCCLSK